MDEQELRVMIRESIARQMGEAAAAVRGSTFGRDSHATFGVHASHGLLPLARGSDEGDGACFIEPSVRCNHCGYCVSLGH